MYKQLHYMYRTQNTDGLYMRLSDIPAASGCMPEKVKTILSEDG